MRDLLTNCGSVTDALACVEALRKDAKDGTSYLWRLDGIRRCLRMLLSEASFSDRGAILREFVRLSDGAATLPLVGSGLATPDLPNLRRFGLQSQLSASNRISLLLVDDDPLPQPIKEALHLDPQPRRPYSPELGDAALKRLTLFSTYRTPTQKSAVRALLTMPSTGSLAVTMPTGSGKSLLFQLGTLWCRQDDPWACSVVIVPTIALAHDHERTLRAMRGLEDSRALTGELSLTEREALLLKFNRGEIPILLLSPELALGGARDALLTAARPATQRPSAAKGHLVALFVDEAHIVESWGRSFRPDFQRLPALVDELCKANPEFRVILLSATIGDQARTELRRAYGTGRHMLEIDARTPRYEFDIVSLPQANNATRDETILRLIDRIPRPCILYTTTVAHAEELYRRLTTEMGYRRVSIFTGDISDPAVRRNIVNDWNTDKIDLVVATSAFGLGVDKPDVRAIVHACIPESSARYYQEIGRASRDGHQGLALCVWSRSSFGDRDDIELAYGQATKGWLGIPLSLKRWWAMVRKSRTDGGLRSVDGLVTMDFAIDAFHGGIEVDSELNQQWNMTLLNLLQRANAIRILVVTDREKGGPLWRAEIFDHRILDETDESIALLSKLFALREDEKSRARKDVNKLVSILAGTSNDCTLAELFQTVEADHPWVHECGHCDWCRSVHASPPTRIFPSGLGTTWPDKPRWADNQLPSGITVIYPEDDGSDSVDARLVGRLAASGIEQFVVPDKKADDVAGYVAMSRARLGFVLKASQLLDASGWSLANLPTALLLPTTAEPLALYLRCKAWQQACPEQSLICVSLPGLKVGGRPFEQIASQLAPYPEAILDKWAIPTRAMRGDRIS